MPAVAGSPVAVHAPGILTRRALEQRLARYRLPSYAWMHDMLYEWGQRMYVLDLWKVLFGGVPRDTDPRDVFEMQCQLAGKVHRELFPVDLGYMDDCYNSGERDVLGCGLLPQTYGLPWELCDLEEMPAGSVPLLAFLGLGGILEESDCIADPDEIDGVSLMAWWRGRVEAGDLEQMPAWNLDTGLDAVQELHRALSLLDPPLNGLATGLLVVLKNSGNLFLDAVPSFWGGDYDDWNLDEWCWCATCVDELAKSYALVRPRVEELDAYYDWYQPHYAVIPERRRLVARTLARIAAGGWHIGDGELVFPTEDPNE